WRSAALYRAKARNKIGCSMVIAEGPPKETDHEALAVNGGNLCRFHRHGKERRGPKLSVVRALRYWVLWRELRVYDISTMYGHRERDRRVLHAEQHISANAWITSASPKTLSLLNRHCGSEIVVATLRPNDHFIDASLNAAAELRCSALTH